ncbi:MAG: DUF2158 domain-containing protein [Polynucleobacter sp.]|nr:DUF2158 domain-containing protein [Polynucleobacter sp.]
MATGKPKFEIGDTVSLNSGGPVMSVKTLPNVANNAYTCQWFAGKKLDQGLFKEEQLVSAEPKAPLPAPEDEKK